MQIDKPQNVSMLIEVAVALPIHQSFTYLLPPELVPEAALGKRVLVPFGPRRMTGFVLGPGVQPEGSEEIKAVIDVLDETPLFPAAMVPFFRWMANYYMHPLGEVIATALPGGAAQAEQSLYQITDQGREMLTLLGAADPARRILEITTQGPCSFRKLQRQAGAELKRSVFERLVKKGWLERRQAMPAERLHLKSERFVRLAENPVVGRRAAQRERIAALLAEHGAMSLSQLKSHVATAPELVRAMARDNQVIVENRPVFRDPFGEPIIPDSPPRLTEEQAKAVSTIAAALGQGYSAFVLAGVTGSGKTEVYLRLAEATLHMGMPVLVLVPEIALITQMARAFRARFGERVALLHSGLGHGGRYDQWRRITGGQTGIAIGARSALFAPFDRLGLVIVDEEHDDSYKQEGALRYNARDMALVRARLEGAVAVLGSATPSMQSIYNVRQGKFQRVDLFERVDQRLMPHIQVHDLGALREERGLRRFLTPALMTAIGETLARREQVLLFLNRRGFSSALVCARCGQPLLCDRCDISLTYHQKFNAYRCHYCGSSRAANAACARCGSTKILRLGVGTEQLQSEMQKSFPTARIARMDRDAVRRKGSLLQILKALQKREIDILVGTQMVAKGHDYPHITLVGIICADLSLSLPDFRAGERTFQLLAQVAGRAGRGQSPGEVILQTYNPDHFSIVAARNHDHEAFYRQEIEFRKALQYPPFTRMIQLRIHGRDRDLTAELAERLGERCATLIRERSEFASVEMLGPIEAPLARIAGRYRRQLLLKGRRIGELHGLARELLFGPQAVKSADAAVTLDVDPVFLM